MRNFSYAFLIIPVLIIGENIKAQTVTQTFTTSGTFTVPSGVTSITVECWGGGGAGGGEDASTVYGGGGGAGGAYARKILYVTPGTDYTVTVGGIAAGTTGAGADGNPSWFGTVGTVYAEGGEGGAAPNGGTVAGGAGSALNSIGDVVYAGGSGASGTGTLAGAGGGGAGSTGIGGNAAGMIAGTGTALNGGNGGAGRNNEGNGNDGLNYGGGGAGAFVPDGSNHDGGDGVQGLVVVTYIAQVYNTPGTWTFHVPAGVTSVTVQCWGAGGAGGGNTTNADGGGGGGGGAYSRSILSVIPGNDYSVYVGTGGIGSTGNGGNGGDSWFNTNATILAKGGSGGFAPVGGNGGVGGTAGTSASSIGTFVYSGGNGGTGRNNNAGSGGPGGSSAGTGANGTPGPGTWTTITAGSPPEGGGSGGNGGGPGINGSVGIVPGGGGGGSGDGNRSGGNGAAGQVIITWDPPYRAQFTAMNIGSTNWAVGEQRTVTVTVTNTGSATWTDADPDINIGVKWNAEPDYLVRVNAAGLAPGASRVYSLQVRAPGDSPTDNLTFDVVNELDCWFGNNNGSCGPGNTVYTSPAITMLPVTYYSQGSGDPANLSNWNTNPGGGGYSPANFTSGYQTFIVQTGHNMTAAGNWTVSGTNTQVQISNNASITATGEINLSAGTTFRIDNGGTYNHNNNTNTVWNGTETLGNTSTVNYGYGGAQSVAGLTYGNLTISGSGIKTLAGNTIVNSTLNLSSGTLAVASNSLTLNGPAIAGTPNNLSTTAASTLVFGGSSAGITVPSSVALLNNLTIDNTNGISLTGPLSSGTLTFNAGILNTTATNVLTITNTATGSIGGATATSFVNGHLARTLLANRTGNATYSFPVGDGANYRPLDLVNITTGAVTPVVLVSETGSGALNGDETTITGMAPRNWQVQVLSGSFTNAFIRLTENGLDFTKTIGQSSAVAGVYSSVGGTGIGATITTASAIAGTSLPAYFAVGTTVVKTLYSYQSGDWNSANTWTIDPSGTLWIGASVPTAADHVVILNGRTVTINQNGKNCLSLEIRLGGNIDLQTFNTHDFGTVTGQGTLRLSSGTFPGGTYTDFVAATGGTVEYYNYTGNLSTTQTTYNNLILSKTNNNATSYTMTLASDLSLNGNLTLNRTQGTGTVSFILGNNATARTITVNGNISNNAGCSIGVGNFNAIHTINLYGDLTNNGTIRFTNRVLPWNNNWYNCANITTTGAADIFFLGASNNTVTCNGTTDFHRFVQDKGSDQTYILEVFSSDVNNFRLWAPNNYGPGATKAAACGTTNWSPVSIWKNLYVANGTLKLNENITIPSLTEGGQDFNIVPTAQIWINGANVTTTQNINGTGYTATTLAGTLRISSGSFSTGGSAGFVLGNGLTPTVLVEGGTLDVSQIWTTGAGGTNISYTQTGGVVNLRANGEDHGGIFFELSRPECAFRMSGGTINFLNGQHNGGAWLTTLFDIRSDPGNVEVTGGTINVNLPANSYGIISSAPFYDVNLTRASGATSMTVNLNNTVSPSLSILHDLTINANCVLNSSATNVSLNVGRNFTINAGGTYTPNNNTTTFNGIGGQVFTNTGTITTGLNNFVLSNSSNTNITNNLTIRGYLTINNSCFLNDQGYIIGVAGDVTNSGTHTSTGIGAIILNGGGLQTIGGSGDGIFGNLTVNKTGNIASLSANQSVTGNLRLVNRILDINTHNLRLSASSNIYDVATGTPPAPTTFGNAKMITTTGQQSDGGLTKAFGATGTFLYPVGTGTVYHPGSITISQAPASWGDITVRPVSKAHPFAITGNEVMTYYWKVTSDLITGIQPGSVSHSYQYAAADVGALINTYVTAVYNPYTWTPGAAAQVDKINRNILFPAVNIIDGEFTAGVPAAFTAVKVFYSHRSGDWDTQSTWSNVDNNPLSPDATTFPGPNDPVVIGDGGANNHVVTILAGSKIVGGLQISTGSTLDITTTTGHNFGAVPDLKVLGTGTLRLSSNVANPTFPSGDFGNFLGPDGGTVEYYTQSAPSPVIGVAYTLPSSYISGVTVNILNYCNLKISAANGRNITLPNSDITVYKDFNINVSLASTPGIAQLNNQNTTRTVTVRGNLNIDAGNLRYTNGNNTAQNVVVLGDVNIANGAVFDVANANAATNLLSIQGNLTNNGTFDMFTSATRICNVTFTGTENKQISGTTAVRTDFNILTVNKGTDRNSVLEATVNALSLNTTLPTALTLTNGTFRLSSPVASPITITLTTSDPFTIPVSGCLSANVGTINIGAANDDDGDLKLQGRLEVMNAGIINIGNGGGSNNDIEYASAGNPEINVSGGALNVDGQIRRNTSNTLGSLWFTQSGGNITVRGNNFNNARGMFEIVNTGSRFNVSGGNLTIQRSGSVSYADVLINPEISNVNNSNGGHTLVIGNALTTAGQTFNMNISSPLWNLTIDGTTNNKTASLQVNPISILNDLTINGNGTAGTGSVFKANNLNVTIGGSLINNNLSTASGADQGGYQSGDAGSIQNTTFTGTGQIRGTGNNLTNFANLIIGTSSTTPSVTLGANSDLTVNENLTLTSGTLSDGGNTITVLGNIANSAVHTSPLAPGGGIFLSSGNKQILSGNGSGKYGNITINNASGVDMTANNMVTGQLSLAGGRLYIDDYKLTMDVNSSFSGPFDADHMVESNGVLSDAGLQKLFPGSATGFIFPIGSNGKYRPAVFTITASDAGSIKVVPVASAHPVTNDPDNDQLNYYWKTTVDGFSSLTSSTQVYRYGTSEVAGDENLYHGALYNNFAWIDFGSSVIDPLAHTITITRSDLLAGEYTAGEVANFSNKHKLYSLKTGNWSDPTAWAEDLPTNPACGYYPDGNPVFIQPGHTISMDINNAYAYSVNIEGTFDLGVTAFHNLGYIIDTNHAGTGRMRLQATPDNMFLFPGGNYNGFMASPGTTVEFYGTNNATLPLKPGNIYKPYQNVEFTDIGIKYMSAENLKIMGNLTINNGATLNNTLFNKSLYILGNWRDNNVTQSGFIPGTGFTSFEGTTAQTLIIATAGITENYYDFRINNPLGLTLSGNGNVQISNRLYLTSGAITTNTTNSLTLNSASVTAVTGGSSVSFINGPLRKRINAGSYFTFPVGKSGSPARYGNVHIFNVTGAGIWQGEYFNDDPTNNTPSLDKNARLLPISHVSSNEYWQIVGATGGSGNVTLRWDANSGYSGSSLSTRSKIRVVEWNPAGSPVDQWEYRGKILNDNGPESGTVTTDSPISLAPGTDLHYLTIGDEGLPTATITSPLTASICNDAISSTTITVALTGTPPWSLHYQLGTHIDSIKNIGSSPASIVITSASAGITQPIVANTVFNFRITNVNDLTGNPGTTDYITTVAVTVRPIPSNTITGKTSVGTGELVNYSTPADANTYAWTLSSNGSPLTGNSSTYAVTWGAGTPGPYTISLVKTHTNGCQSTNSIDVTTSTTPTPDIDGDQYVCAGSTGQVYSTDNVSGHDYTWSISPAGAGTINSGAGTNSITVTWNGAAIGNTVSVREHVTGSGSPGIYTDATLPVDVGIQPSASMPDYEAPLSVCNNSAAAIEINNSEEDVRYQIRLNSDNSNVGTARDGDGGTITLNTTAITSNTTFNIYAYTLAPFNCAAQLNNPASTFTISPLPAINYGTITSGNQTICNGSTPNTIDFSTAPSGGTGTFDYTWYSYNGLAGSCPTGTSVPAGWTIIAGATSDTFAPPALESSMSYAAMITPTGSPSCGTTTWASGCRQVTVIVKPNASIISGITSTCAGNAGEEFSVTNNATWTYTWDVEDNDGTVNGSGNSINIDWLGNDAIFTGADENVTSVTRTVSSTVRTTPDNGCPTVLEWEVEIFRLPETGPTYHIDNIWNE